MSFNFLTSRTLVITVMMNAMYHLLFHYLFWDHLSSSVSRVRKRHPALLLGATVFVISNRRQLLLLGAFHHCDERVIHIRIATCDHTL